MVLKSNWVNGEVFHASDLNSISTQVNANTASKTLTLLEFGAVAGTYDATTRAMTGADNTTAINAALATGKPVIIPPGYFYYTGQLQTDVPGSGLIGCGSGVSYLMTDESFDWHIAVEEGCENTKWVGFSMIGPLNWKAQVRVATTVNGTLATAYENGDTVDGVVLATGDRILLKNQTPGSENGVYVVQASGAPVRATDNDTSAEYGPGSTVFVSEGTANINTAYRVTNKAVTLGTTALTFEEVTVDYNRALNIGLTVGGDPASTAWDASGTWIDDFVTTNYCAGVHVAAADHVRFGSIEVYEAGNSRAEPGSYGITCSGSYLHGKRLRCANTTTRGRHAIYYTGLGNDCFVEYVEAVGFDLAAIQNRCADGGGKRNGFGRARFEDCNTNSSVEPVNSLAGVVNFTTIGEVPMTATGARIGDYVAINCGGFPGPRISYMPNSRCGTVEVYGHSTDLTTDHYGSQIFNSPNTQLPHMVYVSGFDAAGLNDATFQPLVVDTSASCYGGGVRMHSGAMFLSGIRFDTSSNCSIPAGAISLDGTYTNGVLIDDSTGVYIADMTLAGTYSSAVNWAGTTNACNIDKVKPLAEPTVALFDDDSTGARHNVIMRAPGYDWKEFTTGTTIDVSGYRDVRLTYGGATTITNMTGLQQGAFLKVTAINANAKFTNLATGVGEIRFRDNVVGSTRVMGTRDSFIVTGHLTGTTGSYVYRWLEAQASVTPRVDTVASSATPSVSSISFDGLNITALAAAITSVTIAGTLNDGMEMTFRIKDNGTPRAIAWGASFVGTLLTTTIASKTHIQKVRYDAVAAKWAGFYADTAGY